MLGQVNLFWRSEEGHRARELQLLQASTVLRDIFHSDDIQHKRRTRRASLAGVIHHPDMQVEMVRQQRTIRNHILVPTCLRNLRVERSKRGLLSSAGANRELPHSPLALLMGCCGCACSVRTHCKWLYASLAVNDQARRSSTPTGSPLPGAGPSPTPSSNHPPVPMSRSRLSSIGDSDQSDNDMPRSRRGSVGSQSNGAKNARRRWRLVRRLIRAGQFKPDGAAKYVMPDHTS